MVERLIDDGTRASTYVQSLRGRINEDDDLWWSRWPEIRRCNPLTAVSAPFRAKLREERDAALRDSRLKGAVPFLQAQHTDRGRSRSAADRGRTGKRYAGVRSRQPRAVQ